MELLLRGVGMLERPGGSRAARVEGQREHGEGDKLREVGWLRIKEQRGQSLLEPNNFGF